MIWADEWKTGEDIVHALRVAARQREVSLYHMIAPITAHPSGWLKQLEHAAKPTARTRERVRALLAGEPIPRSINPDPLRAEDRARRPEIGQEPSPAEAVQPKPERLLADQSMPCFHCGVRADVGCRHRPWIATPAAPGGQGRAPIAARFATNQSTSATDAASRS